MNIRKALLLASLMFSVAKAEETSSIPAVDEVVKLLDSTIHLRIKEYAKIGEESRELQERANKALEDKRNQMLAIFKDMLPLEDRLRKLYPDMSTSFDKMKALIAEEKK